MSDPPSSNRNRDDDYSQNQSPRDEYADDEEDLRQLRERRNPRLPPIRNAGMLNQDVIKRRTNGVLSGLNILPADIEKENLHSIARVRGDGNFRESNFSTLKHVPKSRRMFKELLVTGKFKEINKEVEPKIDEQEVYPIDEEDILEYQLFQSIDSWSRRISEFLNLCAGVIVGMFVVFSVVLSTTGNEEEYALYFSQLYTLFINLAVVFSVAETLINYEKFRRLARHNDNDSLKFQGYFIISLVWLILFLLSWLLIVILPIAVVPMSYKNKSKITDRQRLYFEWSNIIVGIIFSLFFALNPFINRDDYYYDSYEKLYSDDDMLAADPDAIEMTAYV